MLMDFTMGHCLFLDHIIEKGFLPQVTHHTIISTSTVNQLIDKLQTYAPKSNPLVKQIIRQSLNSSKM